MKIRQKIMLLLVFAISPLIALFIATRSFVENYSKWIVILFVGHFSSTMILDPSNDGYRHMMLVENNYVGINFSDFFNAAIDILLLSPPEWSNDDLFLHIFAYISGSITGDSVLFFLLTGLVFGFFYISTIHKLFVDNRGYLGIIGGVLLVMFLSTRSLDGIQHVRYWTAMWIFVYAIIFYAQKNEVKYLILALSTPLVHFGFFFNILAIPLYFIIKNYPKASIGILFLSFLGAVQAAPVIELISSTDLGASKTRGYISNNSVDYFKFHTGRSFHAVYYRAIFKFVTIMLFISALFIFKFHKTLHFETKEYKLAVFSISLFVLSNLATFSAALQSRSFVVVSALMYAYMIYVFVDSKRKGDIKTVTKFSNLVYLSLIPIAIYIFTRYSIIGDYTDIRVISSPFLAPFLGQEGISIKEFIRSLFSL